MIPRLFNVLSVEIKIIEDMIAQNLSIPLGREVALRHQSYDLDKFLSAIFLIDL
jgi:hypothetical protein